MDFQSRIHLSFCLIVLGLYAKMPAQPELIAGPFDQNDKLRWVSVEPGGDFIYFCLRNQDNSKNFGDRLFLLDSQSSETVTIFSTPAPSHGLNGGEGYSIAFAGYGPENERLIFARRRNRFTGTVISWASEAIFYSYHTESGVLDTIVPYSSFYYDEMPKLGKSRRHILYNHFGWMVANVYGNQDPTELQRDLPAGLRVIEARESGAGTKFLLFTKPRDSYTNPQCRIYSYDLESEQLSAVTDGFYIDPRLVGSADLSPDDQHILYITGNEDQYLYSTSTNSINPILLSEVPIMRFASGLPGVYYFLSNDSENVVFLERDLSTLLARRVSVDGSFKENQTVPITKPSHAMAEAFHVSKDANKLYYFREDLIYEYDFNRGTHLPLSLDFQLPTYYSYRITTDEGRIVFAGGNEADSGHVEFDLTVLNMISRRSLRLSDFQSRFDNGYQLNWELMPQNSHVLYWLEGMHTQHPELYLAHLAGGEPRNLLERLNPTMEVDSVVSEAIAFHPDGESVVLGLYSNDQDIEALYIAEIPRIGPDFPNEWRLR